MLNKTKQLYHYKIEKVLNEYNVILLYQHSGLNTKKWRKLREELSKIPFITQRSCVTDAHSSVADHSGITSVSNATVFFSKDSELRGKAIAAIFVKGRIANLSHRLGGNTPYSALRRRCDSLLYQSRGNKDKTRCMEESSTTTMYRGPLLLIGCMNHQNMVLAHNTIAKQAKDCKYTVLSLGGVYHRNELNPKDLYQLLSLNDSVYASLLHVAEAPLHNLTQQLTISQHDLLHLIRHIG
jgi:hypothetical protein